MTEWIFTSSVVITVVIALRTLLKGKISLRLQYSLWLLVLLRLLIPFSIPSPMSILNILPVTAEIQPVSQSIQLPLAEVPEVIPHIQQSEADIQETPVSAGQDTPVSLPQILSTVWITGMCVTAIILTASNLHFALRLRRTRTPVEISNCPLPVYRTNIVATPCLFGLTRPRIYLTPGITDGQAMTHVLTHELTHYKHMDHIWSFLRCVCLILHWYNPLVWVAAALSKLDAELACDEASIQKLGEIQRIGYGQTLIGMTCAKRDLNTLLLTATTMLGSKKALKERIRLLVKRPKTPLIILIIICLTVAVTAGCTFTGAKTPSAEEPSSENIITLAPFSKTPLSYNPEPYYLDDGIQACFVNAEGTVYIWDCLYNNEITESVLTDRITYLGDVTHNDPYTMPAESLTACRLPAGTKLYLGSDIYGNYQSHILYCKPCPGSDDPESFGRFIPEADIRGQDRWWEKESTGTVSLTVDELKDLIGEKGNLLYTADFEGYTQIMFGDCVDYRILPVEGNYRLFLMFHRNPEVEVLHSKFYHIDSPENVIDPLTDSIAEFLEKQ